MNMPEQRQPDRSLTLLIEKLRAMIDVQSRLLDTVKREREAIVSLEPVRLLAAVQEKDDLCREAERIEGERREILDTIGIRLGFDPERGLPITIKDISGRIDDRSSNELESLRQELKNTIDAVQRSNEANQMLVRHSLDWVKEGLDGLDQIAQLSQSSQPVYRKTGAVERPKKSGHLFSDMV